MDTQFQAANWLNKISYMKRLKKQIIFERIVYSQLWLHCPSVIYNG